MTAVDLSALLERAESGEAGYGFDCELGAALNDHAAQRYQHPGSESQSWPNYTVRLDDAIALCKRQFPDWALAVGECTNKRKWRGHWWAELFEPPNERGEIPTIFADAKTAALAVCIATLRAHVVKGPTEAEG